MLRLNKKFLNWILRTTVTNTQRCAGKNTAFSRLQAAMRINLNALGRTNAHFLHEEINVGHHCTVKTVPIITPSVYSQVASVLSDQAYMCTIQAILSDLGVQLLLI